MSSSSPPPSDSVNDSDRHVSASSCSSSSSSSTLYEQGQQILEYIPHVTGALSMLGSCIIIGRVVWNKRRRQKTYHRLICALSCSDVISSFSYFSSTWPMIPFVPDDKNDSTTTSYDNPSRRIIGANGTKGTCTAQGFAMQFGSLCTIFYNVMLSIHYILTVRYNFTEHRLKTYVEPYLLLIPIIIGLIFSITALLLGTYNNARLGCWIGLNNNVCNEMGFDVCNHEVLMYRWALFYGPCWIALTCITILQLWLFWTVRQTERKTKKYTYNNSSSSLQISNHMSSCNKSTNRTENNNSRDLSTLRRKILFLRTKKSKSNRRNTTTTSSMTRQVARPAALYVLIFYITWIPYPLASLIALIWNIYPSNDGYYIHLLLVIFLPLQGFWNCFVYHRRTVMLFLSRSYHKFLQSFAVIKNMNCNKQCCCCCCCCCCRTDTNENNAKEESIVLDRNENEDDKNMTFEVLEETKEKKENDNFTNNNETKKEEVNKINNLRRKSHSDYLSMSRRLSSIYTINTD